MELSNSMLVRYWFHTQKGLGFGVTAYSLEDAKSLLAAQWPSSPESEILEVVPNINISSLDQGHVAPNMGLANVRGVWFPCLNV
jgi:hypothetical protein